MKEEKTHGKWQFIKQNDGGQKIQKIADNIACILRD